jgi:flagellin-specific chaperone FliS
MKSKTLYDVLLADALNDLERIREQYERLKELEPIWKEIEKIKKRRGRRRKSDGDGEQPSA